jgi:hypothetical protein
MNQSLARLAAGTLLASGALVAVAPVVSAEGVGEDTAVQADVNDSVDGTDMGVNVLSGLGVLVDRASGTAQGAAAPQASTPPPASSATAAGTGGVALRPKVDVGIERIETGGVAVDVNGGVDAAANLTPAAPTGNVLTGENTLLGGIGAFLRELLGIR